MKSKTNPTITDEVLDLFKRVKFEFLGAVIVSMYLSITVNPFVGWAVGMVMNIIVINLGMTRRMVDASWFKHSAREEMPRSYIELMIASHAGIEFALKNIKTNPDASETFLIVLEKNFRQGVNAAKMLDNGADLDDVKKYLTDHLEN